MTKTIQPAYATCLDDDEVLTVAVGDDSHAPRHYLIIARFDEDDRSIDLCIGFQDETTEHELEAAIEAVELQAWRLSVTLTEAAARRTDARRITAELARTTDLAQLSAYLRDIFQGSSTTLVLP